MYVFVHVRTGACACVSVCFYCPAFSNLQEVVVELRHSCASEK
jgi:hypothetical protein